MHALEVGRDAVLPERQVLRQVLVQRLLGAVEAAQIGAHVLERRVLGHPPERVELVRHDHAKPELSCHVDLRRQQARRLDLAVEQRLQPRAEAAGVDGLDVLERQILLQPIRHVEVAAGAHAD